MREGLTISGLNTTSTIWVAAAPWNGGRIGEYTMAFVSMGLWLIVLTGFGYVQEFINKRVSRTLDLHIRMDGLETEVTTIEERMGQLKIKFLLRRQTRDQSQTQFLFEVVGKEKVLQKSTGLLSVVIFPVTVTVPGIEVRWS